MEATETENKNCRRDEEDFLPTFARNAPTFARCEHDVATWDTCWPFVATAVEIVEEE